MERLTTLSDDGEPLAYRVSGLAGKAPLLTLNGLLSSVQHWRYFTPHFAARRPVVSWEYRGHGGQPAPHDPRSATVARFADDAHAVWSASGMGPSVVTGLSFGVQVALELWRRHPSAVRALVLICGTAGHPFDHLLASPRARRTAAGLVRGLGGGTPLARPVRSIVQSTLRSALRAGPVRRLACELAYATGGARRDACPREVLDDLFAHVAELDVPLIAEVVASYIEHTAVEVLPTITVPTLIIAGDRDQLTPVAVAERMAHAIPRSRLVVFPGHSHLVQVERPDEVHAAIDGFLAEHTL